MNASNTATGDLYAYLQVLAAGARPGQFFDVRYMTADGRMRMRFVSALCVDQAANLIARLGWQTDVYVGVALRNGRGSGGKRAIGGSRLVYIECDQPDYYARLERFAVAPSMIVASGTPGHLHVYWSLQEFAGALQVESANRRLALELGGDLACVDIARILRPPQTANHKHSTPRPVRLIYLDQDARHALSQLAAALSPDPRPACLQSGRASSPRTGRNALDRALLAITAEEYVRVLTKREPNSAGKVLCPFHEETDPSLQLYPDGTFYCYGRHKDTGNACRMGGTIFDFAAGLWGIGTKQDDFLELRRRLAALFALTPTSSRRS